VACADYQRPSFVRRIRDGGRKQQHWRETLAYGCSTRPAAALGGGGWLVRARGVEHAGRLVWTNELAHCVRQEGQQEQRRGLRSATGPIAPGRMVGRTQTAGGPWVWTDPTGWAVQESRALRQGL
jgi:hypothetical protein